MKKLFTLLYICIPLLFTACSSDDDSGDGNGRRMHFVAYHPSELSRASASAFENGDCIGIFVAEDTAELQIAGNTVTNEPLTFDGTQWNSNRELYWEDGTYTVYAFYPHMRNVNSIEDYSISVATDQSLGATDYSSSATDARISAYEASDLLFARTDGVTASAGAVPLRFAHCMSRLVIRLIKGEDYEGELPETVDVYVHNTVTDATLNLKNGMVTKSIKARLQTIKARQESTYTYAAIIVPQRIPNRVPLIEVVINNVSYIHDGSFVFQAGTQHIVNFILDKNPNQSLMIIAGEKNNW